MNHEQLVWKHLVLSTLNWPLRTANVFTVYKGPIAILVIKSGKCTHVKGVLNELLEKHSKRAGLIYHILLQDLEPFLTHKAICLGPELCGFHLVKRWFYLLYSLGDYVVFKRSKTFWNVIHNVICTWDYFFRYSWFFPKQLPTLLSKVDLIIVLVS